VCALFHTGGTTGRPKVVRLTHGNQIHAAFGFAQVFGYDEQDTIINGFPFFHVGGTITAGLSVLAAGGHVIVPSPYALRPQAVVDRYWEIAERFKATVVSGVPTSIAALTDAWRPGTDVSSVRMAITGGAVLPRAVGSRFEATTGIRLFETYGMTETAAAIAFNPGRGTAVAGSVGFRAPFSETRIVRLSSSADVCAAEETGVVQVRGPQVFPGYLNPLHNEGVLGTGGWLTTGDIGYLTADHRLVLTGREKDLIVRSGHNIDPAAIEDVANRFEGVQISAAVGMPDQRAGEVPALFVVPRPGCEIDLTALQDHMQKEVHEPAARPRSIQVIESLPVTAVGKVFKPALRDLAIKEKVRLDVSRICGPAASAIVDVRSDGKNTMVDVTMTGASTETIVAVEADLKPLPQTYIVRSAMNEASEEAVRLTLEGGIATLTLNRPQSLNALSHEVMTALDDKVRTLAGVAGLRVVVITGAGRAFSAGGDLIEFDRAFRADKRSLLDILRFNQAVLQRVEDLPVPVIGAANGTAVAGGLELLLCCDIILAAEEVRIGDGHTRYGIVPAGGATVRLIERTSPARAAQLFYTAALIEAGTLKEWGLVNEVVPKVRLISRAMEIAREISERSPEAIKRIKALTARRTRTGGRDDRFEAELKSFEAHLDGTDLAKGLATFRAKQPPRF
jgi:enoyl-CoA hydratase/carnithine racemase